MKITKCDICNNVVKLRAETAEVRINFYQCYELCHDCARKHLTFFLKRAAKDENQRKNNHGKPTGSK